MAQRAKKRFFNNSGIHVWEGDSVLILPLIMKQIKSNVLFWLDGHYSHGITSMGEKPCPIYEEISAINSVKYAAVNYSIFIDDAKSFGFEPEYPSINDLKACIGQYFPEKEVYISNNIVIVRSCRGV